MFRSLLLPALLAGSVAGAQTFQSNYGAGKYEEGVAVLTDDIAITSVVRHHREGYGYGIQLLRTSLNGNSPVTLDILLPGAAFPQDAVRALDGDIVIAGSIIPTGRFDHDALLLKVTPAGEVVWSWTSDNPDAEDQFLGVDVLDDGYAAAGVWRQGVDSDALLARFGLSGTLSWQDHYGTPQDDQVSGVAHDATGIVAVGRTVSTAGDVNAYTLRTDLQGTEQWQRIWGGEEDDAAARVIRRGDGSFAWVGYTDSYPVGDTTQQGVRLRHVYLMAIQASGDSIWSKGIGDTVRNRKGHAIIQGNNGNLLLGGESELGHRSDAISILTTSTGSEVWQRTYHLQRTDRLAGLKLMPDGGFVGSGKCTGPLGGQVLLMRKNSSGQ